MVTGRKENGNEVFTCLTIGTALCVCYFFVDTERRGEPRTDDTTNHMLTNRDRHESKNKGYPPHKNAPFVSFLPIVSNSASAALRR